MTTRFLGLILLIFLSPICILISLIIKLSSKGPIFFKQERMGKNKKTFVMYKFRTMILNAENIKYKYKHLNQAHGPVFKIYDDPRFTKVGKFLSKTGLDELPQLINIVKGEMDFVGPRPLPVYEAKEVPSKYNKRFSVHPGITSLWVIQGSHKITFEEWMKSDLWYVSHKSFWVDLKISLNTLAMVTRLTLKEMFYYVEGKINPFYK